MFKRLIILPIAITVLFVAMAACSSDDNDFVPVVSLKVVHSAVDAPALHVDYFGRDTAITYSINPALSFGSNDRFTVAAGENRNILFVNSQDTTSTVLSTTVNLPAGNISTLFLTGRDSNVNTLLLEDQLLQHSDSTAGIRFINLAPDSQNLVFEADQGISPVSLGFEEATGFQEVDATASNGSYNFEIQDASGNVLTTYSTTAPVFRNTTLAIIGLVDDGAGGNSLQVVRVDSF